MDIAMDIVNILILGVVFLAGIGWGQWFSERNIRLEKNWLDHGRVVVSMPMAKKKAADMMGLLKGLIDDAERLDNENR